MTLHRRNSDFETSVAWSQNGTRDDIETLQAKAKLRETVTEILLLVTALCTVMLTFYGISISMEETGATIVQKGQALIFSIAIGIFAWLGWFYFFGLLYRLSGKRLVAALSAGFFYIGTLAAIDAPFNMLAIAGGTAVQMSIADTAASYEAKKEVAFTQATTAQRLVPGFKAQADRFRQLEQDEIAHGIYSGGKGAGKVSSGFGQVAKLLDTLVEQLEAGAGRAKSLQTEIARHASEMKAQTFRQGPIRPRVEAVVNAADRMDDLLAQLAQYEYSTSIAATLASLENLFPVPTVATSAFERRQNEELAVIAEMSKPVASALRSGLQDLSDTPTAIVERKRPQNAHNAIRTYWRPLLAEWCAAVFIDIAPAGLLIILIAAWRERDRLRQSATPRGPETTGPSIN